MVGTTMKCESNTDQSHAAFWIENTFSSIPFSTFSRSQSLFCKLRGEWDIALVVPPVEISKNPTNLSYAAHNELVLSRIRFEMVSLEAWTFSSSKTKAKNEVMRQTNDLCLFSSPYPHHLRKIVPMLQCSRPYITFDITRHLISNLTI